MTDAVQVALIAVGGNISVIVVTWLLDKRSDRKLNAVHKVANGTLSHQIELVDAANKRIEQLEHVVTDLLAEHKK